MAVNKNNKGTQYTGARSIDNLKIHTERFSQKWSWTLKLIQLSKVEK